MPVTKKKETYSEAMARLEKIVSQIDNNELEIDVPVSYTHLRAHET